MKSPQFSPRGSAALLFALYLAATVAKAPALFVTPRFWAEEGVVYFLQGRELGFWEALWAMPLGYLSLPANLAGWLSAQLPLLHAPRGGLTVSLAIQLLLPWIVIANRFFDGDRIRQAMLLAMPIVVIQSAETWLNSINGQFWLMIAAALVLAAPTRPAGLHRHALDAAVVALAGLSGPGAAFLAPLFGLRAIIERHGIWAIYAALASSGAVLVLLGDGASRALSFPPDLFGLAAGFQLVANNVCIGCALRSFPYAAAHQPWFVLALPLLAGLYTWSWRRSDASGRWMLTASATLLVLSFASMLGKELIAQLPAFANSRYFFAPAALLFGALAAGRRARAPVALGIMAIVGANGIVFALFHPVVGIGDGHAWIESVEAHRRGETDIVFFNRPFCGFTPDPPMRTDGIALHGDGAELALTLPRTVERGTQVFVLRQTIGHETWQTGAPAWRDAGLFLYGTPEYGRCFGGDFPRPFRAVRSDEPTLLLDRHALGPMTGHRFLIGHGERFAAMLARGDYVIVDGTELAAALPPLSTHAPPTRQAVVIDAPHVDGTALDACARWGAGCGFEAADAFCASRGLGPAVDFRIRHNAPPTRTLLDGKTCTAAHCDRIDWLACAPAPTASDR